MTFFRLGSGEGGSPQLVLGNNRDEYFDRPALSARWNPAGTAVHGVDMQPGREGGTWVAAATNGRVAVLHNILTDRVPTDKRPRGKLVSQFLESSLAPLEYAQELRKTSQEYSHFILLLFKWSPKEGVSGVKFRQSSGEAVVEELGLGCGGLGNEAAELPFAKVPYGRGRLEGLFAGAGPGGPTNEELFGLMSDETEHWPDPAIEAQAGSRLPLPFMRGLSAIFVRLPPPSRYGTRAQTLVRVWPSGEAELVERSLVQPIPAELDQAQWQTNSHRFPFQL